MFQVSRLLTNQCLRVPVPLISNGFGSYQGNPRQPNVKGKRFKKGGAFTLTRFDKDFLSDDTEEDLYYEDGPTVENPAEIQEEFRRQQRQMQNVTLKTIKQKHFKTPQEENLLTWNAKEQLRYLHQEFPHEWTVERLAESFPVSEDGVRKLLKSKFVIRSEEEMIAHDRKVQQRWKAIEAGTSQGSVSKKYINLKYAGGNKTLPSPKTKLIGDSSKIHHPSPGKYASIVKDYIERKEKLNTSGLKEHQSKTADPILLPGAVTWSGGKETLTGDKNISKLELQTSAMTEDKHKKSVRYSGEKPGEETLSERLNYRKLFKYKPRSVAEKKENLNKGSLMNMLDSMKYTEHKHTLTISKERQIQTKEYSETAESSDDFPQAACNITHENHGVRTGETKEFYQKSQPEMYEDLDISKLKSSKTLRNKDDKPYLYQKDNSYYDEDGEFLFKV